MDCIKLFFLSIISVCFCCGAIAKETKLITYPVPISEKTISSYSVSVNGKKIDLYKALSPKYEGGEYYFTYFDFEGEVEVKISSRKEMKNAEIYPAHLSTKKMGNSVVFKADKPFSAVLIRDERNMPLVIFGNPIEKNTPSKDDKNVIYFDEGVHYPNEIRLSDNQTLYIAPGAVVKAPIRCEGKNITVTGRGIISFDNRERFTSPATNFIGCTNLNIDGIIFKDAMTWTLVFRNCNGVNVDNVKICCSRMINDDAIDICNTSNIAIQNCFARAQDDIIAIKGIFGSQKQKGADGKSLLPCENMTIENCLFWTDSANIFRIGYECHTPAMKNLKCKDLFIPFYAPYKHPEEYWSHAIIWLQATHNMPMTDMHFDGINIRSDGQDMPLLIANPRVVKYQDTKTAGNVADCSIKNVTVTGKKGGFKGLMYMQGKSPSNNVKNLTFENINYFGEKQKANSPSVFIGDFVENIVVK